MTSTVVDTMLASILSGLVARTATHPLDTVKARMQVTAKGHSFRASLARSWRAGGLRSLYAGFGIAFFGSGPACCLYFGSYEASKTLLGARTDDSIVSTLGAYPMAAHFLSGIVAETVSCALWVPIDVVKERLQVQAVTMKRADIVPYRGSVDAVRRILATGGLRDLYKGYGATVLSFGPFSAIYLTTYEQLKLVARRVLDKPQESDLPFAAFWASGAAAGAFASLVTNPLDMSKMRLQVQRAHEGKSLAYGYRNIVHGMRRIVADDGAMALFRGASARMLFHAPATAITIGLFDSLRHAIGRLHAPAEEGT